MNDTGTCRDCALKENCAEYKENKSQCEDYESYNEVMTNEEWLEQASTEEKARFFSHEMRCEFCPNQEQCDSLGANCKVLWELWLKQPHREIGK